MSTNLKSLLVPMHDYAAELDDDTVRWFDLDHVPERLSCDGFVQAERFALAGIEPAGWDPGQQWTRYLNFYTVESLEVLTSDAYRAYFDMNDGEGTHWRQVQEERNEARYLVSPSRGLRSVWQQRPSPWLGRVSFRIPSPRVLLIILRDVDPSHLDEVNAFLDEEEVPEMLCLPGFLHCERYEAGETLPERPGRVGITQPRYMDIYDLSAPEVLTGTAYSFYRSTPSAWGTEVAQWVTVRGVGAYIQRPSPWLVEGWAP